VRGPADDSRDGEVALFPGCSSAATHRPIFRIAERRQTAPARFSAHVPHRRESSVRGTTCCAIARCARAVPRCGTESHAPPVRRLHPPRRVVPHLLNGLRGAGVSWARSSGRPRRAKKQLGRPVSVTAAPSHTPPRLRVDVAANQVPRVSSDRGRGALREAVNSLGHGEPGIVEVTLSSQMILSATAADLPDEPQTRSP
jgi:hypothetical protein